MKKERIPVRRIVLWIVTAAVLAFVFIQSLLPHDVSAEESSWIMNEIVNPLLMRLKLGPLSHQTVRKLAHIAEYTALAFLLTLCWKGKILRTVSAALAAAFLDETVQLFSNRGAQIQDVWIDLIGITVGVLLGLLFRKAVQHHREFRH